MRIYLTALFLLGVGLLTSLALAADEPKAPASGSITVVDAAGKENNVKGYKIVTGLRPLGWLAAPKPPEEKPPEGKPVRPGPKTVDGPMALVVREEDSTLLVEGVLSLIPIEFVRAIEFDAEKEAMTVKVATAEQADKDATLTGTTKFKGINKLTIEAEVDKGDLGVAEVKFLGGVPKGIKGVKFPAPKVPAKLEGGREATIVVADKSNKYTHTVTDLQALYKVQGGEKLSSLIFFKKTIKIDLAKIKSLESATTEGTEWRVSLTDGNEETLTLLETVKLDDQAAQLEGFLGKTPVGYKLFPASAVQEIKFAEKK